MDFKNISRCTYGCVLGSFLLRIMNRCLSSRAVKLRRSLSSIDEWSHIVAPFGIFIKSVNGRDTIENRAATAIGEIQVALDAMFKHKGKWVTLEDMGLVTEDLKNAVSCIRETLGA